MIVSISIKKATTEELVGLLQAISAEAAPNSSFGETVRRQLLKVAEGLLAGEGAMDVARIFADFQSKNIRPGPNDSTAVYHRPRSISDNPKP